MAKYERSFTGNFSDFMDWLDKSITSGSISASYEDGTDFKAGDVRLAVRVYERYSMMGGNRVSMNVTVMNHQDRIYLCAITSGGSKAVFFKVNTFGESAFLDSCIDAVEKYLKNTAGNR